MVETQQVESGDQYQYENVGKIEVQRVELKSPGVITSTVDGGDDISVVNIDEVRDNGTFYVRFYAYRSGMPGSAKLSEFLEKTEPLPDDEDD